MARSIDEVTVDSLTFTVKEMTVNEIVLLLNESSQLTAVDMIASMATQPVGIYGLRHMTNLTVEQLGDLTPTTLEKIKELCEVKNKAFFALIHSQFIAVNQPTSSESL